MNNVIAFIGEYGSGKDYFCEFLANTYHAQRFAFADALKKFCVELHPWMEYDYPNDVKDKPLISPFNPNNMTPRDIWLKVSTAFRDIDPFYFTRLFEENELQKVIYNPQTPFIITDFRTLQEWELLRQYNITVLKIDLENRGDMPPSSFEDFVRGFNAYHGSFVNKKDGTERFEKFFDEFKRARNLTAFY